MPRVRLQGFCGRQYAFRRIRRFARSLLAQAIALRGRNRRVHRGSTWVIEHPGAEGRRHEENHERNRRDGEVTVGAVRSFRDVVRCLALIPLPTYRGPIGRQ